MNAIGSGTGRNYAPPAASAHRREDSHAVEDRWSSRWRRPPGLAGTGSDGRPPAQTAQANNAPSWSQGLTSTPGYTMSSVGSSVNGSTVSISGDNVLDATGSGCATVAVRSMTVELRDDLTIYANGFSTIDGTSFVSAGGAVHRVNLVTKMERSTSLARSPRVASPDLASVRSQCAR